MAPGEVLLEVSGVTNQLGVLSRLTSTNGKMGDFTTLDSSEPRICLNLEGSMSPSFRKLMKRMGKKYSIIAPSRINEALIRFKGRLSRWMARCCSYCF